MKNDECHHEFDILHSEFSELMEWEMTNEE